MEKDVDRTRLLLPEIKDLIGEKNVGDLNTVLSEFEPVEIAELSRELTFAEKKQLFSLLDPEFAADIFQKIDVADQIELLEAIDRSKSARILEEVEPDDRADIFGNLPEELVQRFFRVMAEEEIRETRELLSYPPNTAGGQLTTRYAWVGEDATVGDALAILRSTGSELETIYYVYVLDKYRRLSGVVSLKTLVLSEPGRRISDVMERNVVSVPLEMDQEKVAREIGRYDLLAVPVVDGNRRMKGIVTVDDVIDVLQEEQTEDVYRLGAVGESVGRYLRQNPVAIARGRFQWLFILVIIGLVSGLVMEHYQGILSQLVPLAFFIPLLMDSAGNAGTQASTVVVRGLAVGEVSFGDVFRVACKEFFVGGLVGILLGVFAVVRAVFFNQGFPLGMVVFLTMTATVTLSCTLGGLLPIFFQKVKVDPAVASGPLITTVADVGTLLIYFEIARRILL